MGSAGQTYNIELIHSTLFKWLIELWAVFWKEWEPSEGVLKLGYSVLFLLFQLKAEQLHFGPIANDLVLFNSLQNIERHD